jgi:8-oxo-dGTP pyrophosphatase MutT (NUDIX family)
MAKASSSNNIRFLLGLIPQRNWWTVFKGLPDGKESPYETAVREFEEETGTLGLLQNFQPLATLHGRAGKKRLEIFLHEGSFFDPKKHFCSDRVVTIDDGYMQGKPEIVDVRWMTMDEALSGVDGAKIYKSQQNILEEAHAILMKNLADQTNEAAS